jgi:hypothetical protein
VRQQKKEPAKAGSKDQELTFPEFPGLTLQVALAMRDIASP